MHKILFYNKFIKRLYMFRALCTHHKKVKIVYITSGVITPTGVMTPEAVSTILTS